MAWNPTPEQEAAVNERNRTLLVSAAAGAGKTSTLTRRIIETIMDNGDLCRMLIVTFTRAAAAELRERISAALNAAIAENGYSEHLARQLLALPAAKISTIDSFCLDLVRANATVLGISPAFRISDGAENRLLLSGILGRLIEDCYDGAVPGVSPSAFRSLVESLMSTTGAAKTDEVLLSLYDKVRNYVRSYRLVKDAADRLAENQAKPPFETPWGKYAMDRTEAKLASYPARFSELLPRVEADALIGGKYPNVIRADLGDVGRVLAALKTGDYTEVKAAFAAVQKMGFGKGNMVRGAKDYPLAEEVKALHGSLHDDLSSLREKFYLYTAEEWKQILSALSEKVALLYRILEEFAKRVDEEKRRRAMLSFSDLSCYALSLLYNEQGERSALAEELAGEYQYVYIDEYQDVNEVQHRIFEALSQPRGRFMVGDVKQSIYGFRGAQPDIFADLRKAFPKYDVDRDTESAVISLATNFRSDPSVLAFVNLVFGRHMAGGLGELLGYDDEADRLTPPAGKTASGERVTVAVFEDKKYEANDEKEENESEKSADEGAPEDEGDDAGMAEARYVASEIKRLLGTTLNGRRLQPKDFAILTRTQAAAVPFAKALDELGLKNDCGSDRSFFLKPEILLVLSLLNTIDNPYRDVYLAGLLLSPLYGFTLDELIAIRRATDKEQKGPETKEVCALYEALCTFAMQNPTDAKVARFLSDLNRYRHMAEGCPVHALLWQLYRETNLLSIVSADRGGEGSEGKGSERRASLLLFYDYARRFEAGAYRGLYNFIFYVNQAMLEDQTIEESSAAAVRDDTVRIMTMHKSKGLEFPVCFVCDCGRNFNMKDSYGYALFDRDLGLAVKLRDESTYGILKNPVYNAIASLTVDRAVEENLRLFYVALTRAVDRLYVTATVGDAEILAKKQRPMDKGLDAATTYACKNHLELLLTAAWADGSYDHIVNGVPFLPTAPTQEKPFSTEAASDAAQPQTEKLEEKNAPEAPSEFECQTMQKVIEERFSFAYPDAHLSEIAGKYAVSRLHPGALDESESEEGELPFSDDGEGEVPASPQGETKPAFLTEEKKNDAAERGTATHLFLQFCDFSRMGREGARAELAHLVEERFITAEVAALVRVKELAKFMETDLFARMMRAKKVEKFAKAATTADAPENGARLFRELRFHARFPAAAFVEDEEKKALYEGETVLVQGVMDAVLETEDGRLWLIDYKTDRVWGESAEAELCARHGPQLAYYAAACRDIFGRAPDRVLIYSLALGKAIDLPTTLPEGI